MTDLHKYPPFERWHDWAELDAKAWPDQVERKYTLVPTTCFNCEAGCGLVAYFDRETGEIEKIEGNPEHPGSRGRNCAKGPATLNQIDDPERILHPMKRVGDRGSGKWERISWDQALDEIGARIRKAIEELFKVKVEKVWTANRKGKPRRERLNQLHGRTSRWRKAIVKLAPGNKIDIMGG